MIVKKIKNRKIEKSKSWQIGDLVDYIRFPHNKNPRPDGAQRAERLSLRSGRKKARGGKPRFEAWLRAQGLSRQAEHWRHRAAWEQARHSPPALQRIAPLFKS